MEKGKGKGKGKKGRKQGRKEGKTHQITNKTKGCGCRSLGLAVHGVCVLGLCQVHYSEFLGAMVSSRIAMLTPKTR